MIGAGAVMMIVVEVAVVVDRVPPGSVTETEPEVNLVK